MARDFESKGQIVDRGLHSMSLMDLVEGKMSVLKALKWGCGRWLLINPYHLICHARPFWGKGEQLSS
jgi:hypothetical protein